MKIKNIILGALAGVGIVIGIGSFLWLVRQIVATYGPVVAIIFLVACAGGFMGAMFD